jgi:hypothetical protein
MSWDDKKDPRPFIGSSAYAAWHARNFDGEMALEGFTARVARKMGWATVPAAFIPELRRMFESWYTVDQACSRLIDLER